MLGLRAWTALNEAKVEVRVQFKDVTQGIFAEISRNELVVRIQPEEAVYLKVNTKTPGYTFQVIPSEMDLTYNRRFTETVIPSAYEALILDALKGDHSNFVRDDELDVAWKVSVMGNVRHQILMCVHRSSHLSFIGSMARKGHGPNHSRIHMDQGGRRSSTRLMPSTDTDELSPSSE